MTDSISYYYSQLLPDVVSVDLGVLMTLSIPMASRQTALTVYKAKVIRMPQPEPELALGG